MTLGVSVLADWFERLASVIEKKQAWLSDLDVAIGDGDHGANLMRGFSAVRHKLSGALPATPGELLKLVAMTLIGTVGGASGPLYGTFFLEASKTVGASSALDGPMLLAAFAAGLDGVCARGKAVPGDKTMVDALAPAIAVLAETGNLGDLLNKAAAAAIKGTGATKPMIARKGRASYLGERSIGHEDPGAASSALMFITLAATVAEMPA